MLIICFICQWICLFLLFSSSNRRLVRLFLLFSWIQSSIASILITTWLYITNDSDWKEKKSKSMKWMEKIWWIINSGFVQLYFRLWKTYIHSEYFFKPNIIRWLSQANNCTTYKTMHTPWFFSLFHKTPKRKWKIKTKYAKNTFGQ